MSKKYILDAQPALKPNASRLKREAIEAEVARIYSEAVGRSGPQDHPDYAVKLRAEILQLLPENMETVFQLGERARKLAASHAKKEGMNRAAYREIHQLAQQKQRALLKSAGERYCRLYDEASGKSGPPEHPDHAANLDFQLWQLLPQGKSALFARIVELRLLFSGPSSSEEIRSAREKYGKIIRLVRRKLACRLTELNPWRLRTNAYPRGFEIQQLWPCWRAGLVYELSCGFGPPPKNSKNEKPESVASANQSEPVTACSSGNQKAKTESTPPATPENIALWMTRIADNVLRPRGLQMVRVISKHKTRGGGFTQWHVHGLIWPKAGNRMRKEVFTKHIREIRRFLCAGRYHLEEKAYITPVRNLSHCAWYMARNLSSAYTYRQTLREEAQNSNRPIHPDGGEDVRFYSAPPRLAGQKKWENWAEQGSRAANKPKLRRKEKWTTPFMAHYQKCADEFARRLQKTECNEDERREIFRVARKTMPPEKPRTAWVNSPDGHKYDVVAGNPTPWEVEFFHLRRVMLPNDIKMLPASRGINKLYKPFKDILLYPLSAPELQMLAKYPVEYARPEWEKLLVPGAHPIDPITGKRPTPYFRIDRMVDVLVRQNKAKKRNPPRKSF